MTLSTDHLEADVLRSADGSTLQVRAADPAHLAPFEGETRADGDQHLLIGPLSSANAAALREAFEVLRPRPIGATRTSVGTGDRLGLATAGLGFVPSLRLPPHPAEMDAELPPEIADDVVAVVRECLANAARHAHATAVAVSVSVFSEGVDRVVQVNVSDNGRGIDPTVRRRSGLANMSSRARRHSGWVDAITLEPGTMISWRVTLPVA